MYKTTTTRMYLLTLCLSAIIAAVNADTTTTGRYWLNTASFITWSSAYKTCKDRSSHLAVINSQEEADNLLTLMTIYDTPTVHVGLSDKYKLGKFVSVLDEDIEEIGYNTWRVGYPDTTRGNCVGFSQATGDVGLFNFNCTTNGYPSFCEERRWDRYTLIPGHGYYQEKGLRTWPQARKICRQEGAYLFIINSEAELLEVYRKLFFSWAFVGVTDTLLTGTHVTLFNVSPEKAGYSEWQSGSPYNSSTNPYVSVFQNWFMVSEFHTSQLGFICEHGLITA